MLDCFKELNIDKMTLKQTKKVFTKAMLLLSDRDRITVQFGAQQNPLPSHTQTSSQILKNLVAFDEH